MLYLADVSQNVAVASGVFLGFCFVALIVGGVAALVEDEPSLLEWLGRHWWAGALALAVAMFVPSKTTIYAIAASEMGERALQSPIATKAGRALEAWLDEQLAEEESK